MRHIKRGAAVSLSLLAVLLWSVILSGGAQAGAYVPFPVNPVFSSIQVNASPAPAATVRNINGAGGATDIYANVPSGGAHGWTAVGAQLLYVAEAFAQISVPFRLNGVPLSLNGSPASPGATVRSWHGNGTALHSIFNVPSTGGHYWQINGSIIAGLTAGTLTSSVPIVMEGTRQIYADVANAYTAIGGGNGIASGNGAFAIMYGVSHASLAGELQLYAGNTAGAEIGLYTADTNRLAILHDGTVTLHATTAASLSEALSPACKVHLSADTSTLTGNTVTKIAWDTEDFDANALHSGGNFTAATAGLWRLDAVCTAKNIGSAQKTTICVKNDAGTVLCNSTFSTDGATGGDDQAYPIGVTVNATANQQFEVDVNCVSTGRAIDGGSDIQSWACWRRGP